MSENKPTRVLIWVPLRGESKWRGEGIAQTIENLITNINHGIDFTLVISPHMLSEVSSSLEGFPNVHIRCLSLFSRDERHKFKTYNSDEILRSTSFIRTVLSLLPLGKAFAFFKKATTYFNNILYLIKMFIVTFFHRRGLIFAGYDVIWLPSPIIPFAGKLGGRKVASFWDPFVFEYREFAGYAPFILKTLHSLYTNVNCVITQSKSNSTYLATVLNLPEEIIKVTYVGSPDYSDIIKNTYPKLAGAKRCPDELINYWQMKPLFTKKRAEAFSLFNSEIINKSLYARLLLRMNDQTKIILISTQMRPHKGFPVLMEVLDECVRNYPRGADFHFIFTSLVPQELKNKYAWANDKIYEITRVSNKQHALLYAISNLAIHPSFVEGGLGSYPQFEAASVGVPCLNNLGRHTIEQERVHGPQMKLTYTNFCNTKETAARIFELITDEAERDKNIAATKSASTSWETVAKQYADTFKDIAHA